MSSNKHQHVFKSFEELRQHFFPEKKKPKEQETHATKESEKNSEKSE